MVAVVAAQPCNTGADQQPCDGIVNITELTDHINAWYQCSACVPDLFRAIEAYYGIAPTSNYTSSITRFGITWHFDREYEYGNFSNGDYWIVGPVTITKIEPEQAFDIIHTEEYCKYHGAPSDLIKCTNFPPPYQGKYNYTDYCVSYKCVYKVKRNGFVINPKTGPGSTHAYDSRASGFDENLHLSLPVTVDASSSVVSTISLGEDVSFKSGSGMGNPKLKTAAVLTVLANPPPAGSFRPPYAGTDKPLHPSSDLRRDMLLNLIPVSGTPSLLGIESNFERVWLDHQYEWSGKGIHPVNNMKSYGADIVTDVGVGSLMLLIDYPLEEKETLLIRYVQLGIDLYGLLENGQTWPANGGHMSGRKWPIIFAGIMLDNEEMKNIGYSYPDPETFQEDCQTFYLTQEVLDDYPEYYATTEYYEPLPAPGDPVYGIRACRTSQPSYSQAYRACCNAQSWVGEILSARLMNAEDGWNHDALFDFEDWCMDVWVAADPSREGYHDSNWANAMWYEYRTYAQTYCGDGVCNGTETPESCPEDCATPEIPANTIHVTQSGSGTQNGSDWNNAFAGLPSTPERGYTYYIANGDYPGRTFGSISGTGYITIKKATVEDHGTNAGWQSSYGDGVASFGEIYFNGASYMILDGQVEDGFAVENEGSHSPALRVSNSDHITIENCDIDGNYETLTGDEPTSHTGGSCNVFNMDRSSHVTIKNCKIHDGADDGFGVYNSNHIFLIGSQIYNLYGDPSGGCQAHSDGIEPYNVKHSAFIGNLIYDVRSTSAILFGNWADSLGEGPSEYCDNITLANNIFYTPESGFVVYVSDVRGVYIYNNVFWQGIYGGLQVAYHVTDMHVYNNILHNINYNHVHRNDPSFGWDPNEHHGDYNFIATPETHSYSMPLGPNDIDGGDYSADPRFMNIPAIGGGTFREITAEDFALLSDSPCINEGWQGDSDILIPATDLFGSPRDPLPDIGAIEYGSGVIECETPADPSLECDDDNDCTHDVCTEGFVCEYTSLSGTACDDEVFCNGLDTCSSGACNQHAGDPCDISDWCNPEVCIEATRSCSSPVETCDDNEICTIDTCNAGSQSCTHPINTGEPGCANYLFIDNFGDGEEPKATGWAPGGIGDWRVADGAYQVSGDLGGPDPKPKAYSLIDGIQAQDFVFTGTLRSSRTHDWRDLVLIFGYQNYDQHYLTIFNNGCDSGTNGIFVVSGETVQKIDNEGCSCEGPGCGVLNDLNYHDFKIVRDGPGIDVYFDDMQTPVFTATDDSYGSGLFGVGTINDRGMFDDIMIEGTQ